MYVAALSELAAHIATPTLHEDSVCKFLVQRTFASVDAIASALTLITEDDVLHTRGSFGLPDGHSSEWTVFSALDPGPLSDVIRVAANAPQRDVLVTSDDLAPLPRPPRANSAVSVPLFREGETIGALSVFCERELRQDAATTEFVLGVGNLVGMYLQLRSRLPLRSVDIPREGQDRSSQLTLRQHNILGLLAAGMSTDEIAESLEYHRATILTDTVRIYRTLGVSNRMEAAEAYMYLPAAERGNERW
ncbi:MAG: LuxR C-terminal-related transcriptional regulator [Agromyces sp.]